MTQNQNRECTDTYIQKKHKYTTENIIIIQHTFLHSREEGVGRERGRKRGRRGVERGVERGVGQG